MCVSVTLVIKHAVRMRRSIVVCGLSRSTIFFGIISFSEEKLLNIKFVFC